MKWRMASGLLFVLFAAGTASAQFGADCSSASPGSKCVADNCGSAGPESGCIINGPSCETCYFAGPVAETRAAGQVMIYIANPGVYAAYGLRRGDLVWKLNGGGLNQGDDFAKIDQLRRQGRVVLTLVRASRSGRYRVRTITIPRY